MRQPLFEIGALFDAGYVHPARSGRNHSAGWRPRTDPAPRIDEVLDLVGLTDAAGRRCAATRSACASGWGSPVPAR